MTPAERIEGIARQLRSGEVVQPVTVRDFLQWFDAQRRGYWIVASIRETLETHGVQTDPDFESEYIDSQISFALLQPEAEMQEAVLQVADLSANLIGSSTMVATLDGHHIRRSDLPHK